MKMRISLVLIMVLALATSAHAAISLSLSSTVVDVGNTVTANVMSDNTSMWSGYLVLSEDTYSWSNPIAAKYNIWWPIDPINCRIDPVPGYPGVLLLSTDMISQLPVPGTQFSIQIEGVQPGTIYLDLQASDTYEEMSSNGPLALVVTPEPMTITLLALGGLLLRRRGKK
jgi:hypothetical protein